MYLSRIELDTKRHDTRRAIASPQVLHAAVERCFHTADGEKQRKLWRIDLLRERIYLLTLSPEPPDFTNFSHQFCAPGNKEEIKDYRPIIENIKEGHCFRFRLRGNPTHSVSTEKDMRGKVLAHVTTEQQRGWLMKKAQNNGFGLSEGEFDIVETRLLRFLRAEKNKPVEINTAIFEGRLEVTDADLFSRALTQGIGRAKAYGCGLITVMPLQ